MNYKALILTVILGGATAAVLQESTSVPTPEVNPQATPFPRPDGTPQAPPTPEILPTPLPTPELRASRTPGIGKLDPLRTPGISRTPGGDPGDKIVPPPTPGPSGTSAKNGARLVPGPGFDYGAGHEGRTRDIYLGKVALYH
jgi:hypothetical protein